MHDRCFQSLCELHQLVVSARATSTAEERNPARFVHQFGQPIEFGICWTNYSPRGLLITNLIQMLDRFESHVSRNHDDCDTAMPYSMGHRGLEHARHLLRVRHRLAVVAAVLEQSLRMGFLEIPGTNFDARNLSSNRKHRHSTAMAIVEPVDEMQIAGAAAS